MTETRETESAFDDLLAQVQRRGRVTTGVTPEGRVTRVDSPIRVEPVNPRRETSPAPAVTRREPSRVHPIQDVPSSLSPIPATARLRRGDTAASPRIHADNPSLTPAGRPASVRLTERDRLVLDLAALHGGVTVSAALTRVQRRYPTTSPTVVRNRLRAMERAGLLVRIVGLDATSLWLSTELGVAASRYPLAEPIRLEAGQHVATAVDLPHLTVGLDWAASQPVEVITGRYVRAGLGRTGPLDYTPGVSAEVARSEPQRLAVGEHVPDLVLIGRGEMSVEIDTSLRPETDWRQVLPLYAEAGRRVLVLATTDPAVQRVREVASSLGITPATLGIQRIST